MGESKMERDCKEYCDCCKILEEELKPAMGCTEPIAIAYAAALARQTLGERPASVRIHASGNIIKNVKSVIVPHTDHLRGIGAAAAIGIIAGKPEKELQVIAEVTEAEQQLAKAYLAETYIEIVPAKTDLLFDIVAEVFSGDHSASVRIVNYHTNVVSVIKDGKTIVSKPVEAGAENDLTDHSFLTLETICDFADSADLADVKPLLKQQLTSNMAIAEEGLRGDWGANIGSVYLSSHGDTLKNRAIAMAAAGSDARMSGCELPVVINSGSGNQGLTVSVPVGVYAAGIGASEDKLYRALIISNLVAVYIKSGIGRLSAFCGAVSAGTAAGCAIAYLEDGSYEAVASTLSNAIATTAGMICDGAKPSCAGKIALSLESGFLGFEMYRAGQKFLGGDGIVKATADETVRSVGRLGKDGMRQTDREILHIMVED